MSQNTIDIQALESILSYIVRNPEAVEITRKVDEMGVLLILKVSRDDMGIVIGRNGEMANAIKKYVKKVGQVNNMNIRLRIDEPSEGSNPTLAEATTENSETVSTAEDVIPEEVQEVSPKADLEDFNLN
jgi:uncharacterized protein